MATQTHETTGPAAEAQLDEVKGEIERLEADLETVNQQIGETYARQRTGDKKAGSDLGKLSMKRSGLDSDLRDARYTAQALQASVAAWREGEQQRQGEAALAELARVTAETRDLERTLAEQVLAAGQTAKRLQGLADDWQRERATAGRAGHDVSEYGPRPAPPAGLSRPDVIDDAARAVALWFNRYIEKTPIPARPKSGIQVERDLERKMLAEQRAKNEPTTFTISMSERLHMKQGA